MMGRSGNRRRYNINIVVKLYIYILLILSLHHFGVKLIYISYVVIYSAHLIDVVVPDMV